ncbi:hypothetical protein RJ639_000549 [Escallonia herrerae]|uniref:Uncharacterized protein n=1 Tax=Escallonia herrerae TaxID=1293975 RepID=A0AA88XSX1_9ASTE|nr:hypothetical protein RJ639_000549 [Escallonia herrerae]
MLPDKPNDVFQATKGCHVARAASHHCSLTPVIISHLIHNCDFIFIFGTPRLKRRTQGSPQSPIPIVSSGLLAQTEGSPPVGTGESLT